MVRRDPHAHALRLRACPPTPFGSATMLQGLLGPGAAVSPTCSIARANADFMFEMYNNGTMERAVEQFQVRKKPARKQGAGS